MVTKERKSRSKPKYSLKPDDIEYDFLNERPTEGRLSLLESIYILVKVVCGVDTMTMQKDFAYCGIWTGIILLCIFAAIIYNGMYGLTRSAHKIYGKIHVPTLSYPQLAQAVFDVCRIPRLQKRALIIRYLVDFTNMTCIFMICSYVQASTARAFMGLFEDAQMDLLSEFSIRKWIVLLTLPLILISWVNSLKILAYIAAVADFFQLTIIISTIYFAVTNNKKKIKNILDMPGFTDTASAIRFSIACIISLHGNYMCLPLENNMKSPRNITMVTIIGLTSSVFFTTVIGVVGCWGWQENVKTPITNNFPSDGWQFGLTLTIVIIYIFIVFVNYTLSFWVGFEVIWLHVKNEFREETHWIYDRIWRTCIVILLSIYTFTFSEVTSTEQWAIGTSVMTTGIIVPAVIHFLAEWDEKGLGKYRWRLWRLAFFILIGITVIMLYTFDALMIFFKGKDKHNGMAINLISKIQEHDHSHNLVPQTNATNITTNSTTNSITNSTTNYTTNNSGRSNYPVLSLSEFEKKLSNNTIFDIKNKN